MINVRKIAKDYASSAVAEAFRTIRREPADYPPGEYDDTDVAALAHEYLFETLDGCEDVIYYSKAWAVVADDPTAAQDAYADMMGEPFPADAEGLDDVMTRLAFARLESEASALLAELVDEQWEAHANADADTVRASA